MLKVAAHPCAEQSCIVASRGSRLVRLALAGRSRLSERGAVGRAREAGGRAGARERRRCDYSSLGARDEGG